MATVTIDVKTAEWLYDLYNNLEAADTAYKRCQSDQFRMHLKAVKDNQNIQAAYSELKDKIDAATTTNAPQIPIARISPQNSRKSVLVDER